VDTTHLPHSKVFCSFLFCFFC